MVITPEFFTDVVDDERDMNEVFMKEYNNRVEDWECDEDMQAEDFAEIHMEEWRDWDWENTSWLSLRSRMWYCCGVWSWGCMMITLCHFVTGITM